MVIKFALRIMRYIAGPQPPARLVRLLSYWLTLVSVLEPIKTTLDLDLLTHLQSELVSVTTFTISLWAIAEMLWWPRIDTATSPEVSVLQPSAKGDGAELDDFLRGLANSDIDRVMIIANTGRITVRTCIDEIEKIRTTLPNKQISLEILLRSPLSADRGRASQIQETEYYSNRLIDLGINVETRFFSTTLPFRCVIARHEDGEHSAFISFYAWNGANNSVDRKDSAVQRAIIVQKTRQSHTLLDVCLSWFKHLWGTKIIHTVVFDFDDTLFLTTKPQVNGWLLTLADYISSGKINLSDLNDELAEVFHEPEDAYRWMLNTFLDGQSEDEIFRKTISNPETRGRISQEFRASRVMHRELETIKDAAPIPNILLEELKRISLDYSIVIVSATSEKMIREVISRWSWDIFPYIIGREAPKQPWKDLEVKSQNLIRISSMLGIPINRMVFVGDSDADYRSARQLGMPFIENSYNAEYYGKSSLIRDPEPVLAGHLARSSSPGTLISIISGLPAQGLDPNWLVSNPSLEKSRTI